MARRFSYAPLVGIVFMGAVAAAPAHTQGWQGVVVFETNGQVASGTAREMTMYVRPGYVRIDPKGDPSDPMKNSIVIMDAARRVSTIVVPSQRMYMEFPVDAGDSVMAKNMEKSQITKTSKTEVVAGHACQYWHVVNEDGHAWDVCLASDMGAFPIFSVMGRRTMPTWQRAFGSQNLFPLKSIDHTKDGDKVDMVATSVQAKSVDASMFVPPAGYRKTDMRGMMGAMMGPKMQKP